MEEKKRFVAYFDEGIQDGPITKILDGVLWIEEEDWDFEEDFREEIKSLKLGECLTTPFSGITYTVRIWRVE